MACLRVAMCQASDRSQMTRDRFQVRILQRNLGRTCQSIGIVVIASVMKQTALRTPHLARRFEQRKIWRTRARKSGNHLFAQTHLLVESHLSGLTGTSRPKRASRVRSFSRVREVLGAIEICTPLKSCVSSRIPGSALGRSRQLKFAIPSVICAIVIAST